MRKKTVTAAIAALFAAIALAAQPNQASGSKKHSANQGQTSVILPTPDKKHQGTEDQTKANSDAPTSHTPFHDPNWALVIVGIVTCGFICWQSWETRKAAKAAEKSLAQEKESFIQSQRPKIIVRTLYIKDFLGSLSPPKRIGRIGPEFHGQFYIANVGGTTAKVKEVLSICAILDSLPGKRPWEGKPGCKVDLSLKPGTSCPYPFAFDLLSTDEDSATGIPIGGMLGSNKSLYVMGWIDYEDTSGVLRTTRFCRLYDTKTERFWPVENDPDYESQD